MYTRILTSSLFLLLLSGCASSLPSGKFYYQEKRSTYHTDLVISIDKLEPCYLSSDDKLHLNRDMPVFLLVHGSSNSPIIFYTLSEQLENHDIQTVCFRYNSRDSMFLSSQQLIEAVEELSAALNGQQMTIIGYSQGGLVARKAMIIEREHPISSQLSLQLVTIASPFSGIQSSRLCMYTMLRLVSFGLHDLICWAISGNKWDEITPSSDFIRYPGTLSQAIKRSLAIITDESGSCQIYDEVSQCLKDDFVFSLGEQRTDLLKQEDAFTTVQVKTGHVNILGIHHKKPEKLINILKQQGVI